MLSTHIINFISPLPLTHSVLWHCRLGDSL